jgi:predicted naringenin-chalcone synthase/aryl carrier-like protein
LGEIWIAGKCVTGGYWNDSAATAKAFGARIKQADSSVEEDMSSNSTARFLRTGDLGVVYENQLYITGRLKELVIVRGKKYSPSDIEETLRSVLCPTADPASAGKSKQDFSVRPGGIMTTERMDRRTNQAELVCFIEVNNELSSTNQSISSSSSALATSARSLALSVASSLVRQSKRLPPAVQSQLFKCTARVGARVQKWIAPSRSVHPASAASSAASASASSPYAPLLSLIKQTLLSHYGLSVSSIFICERGTLLKTSSGKLRRAATVKELERGGLEGRILCTENAPMVATVETKSKPSTIGVAKKQTALPPIAAVSARNVGAAASASPSSPPRKLLSRDEIKQATAALVAEELQIDIDTVLQMASSLPALSREALLEGDAAGALSSLGLDSLRAMQLASRINHDFALPLPLSPFMLFENPTFDGLVELIWKLQHQPESVKRTIAANQPPAFHSSSNRSAAASTASSSSAPPSSYPYILGIGTAVPGPGAPQSAIMEIMVTSLEGASEKRLEMMKKIGESAGIERRYSVLPTCEAIYFGRTGLGNNECVETRNEIFKKEAPPLSLTAAKLAIAQWGGDKADLTHVVAVTCTGVMVPGLEFHLLTSLGLSLTTQRLSVQFMGCFGTCAGMKAARAFAMEREGNRVLVVCTELCSLHMQLDERVDNLVGSAIFSDGSGAFIVGASPLPTERPLFEIHQNASIIIPDTLEMMAWELTSSGMSIGLGKEIPSAIYKSIDEFCVHLLKGSEAEGVEYEKCVWAMHPGSVWHFRVAQEWTVRIRILIVVSLFCVS